MILQYYRCDRCKREERVYRQGCRLMSPIGWEVVNRGVVAGGSGQEHYCSECAEKRNQERPILFRQFGNITNHLSPTSKVGSLACRY